MYIEGYAYRKDQDEIAKRRLDRFKELKDLDMESFLKITSIQHLYTKNSYSGKLLKGHPEVTEEELLVFLDDGPCCPFGGTCSMDDNGNFSAIIYTD